MAVAGAAALGGPPGSVPLAPANAQATPTLMFEDNFDGSLLDLTKWGYRSTGPRYDGFMWPLAVSVGAGSLTIQTTTLLGLHFTGQISSQKLLLLGYEQTNGYFEAQVKFNDSPGMWSAFWLQSPTFGNPIGDPATAGVEMDVAEHRVHCVDAPAPTPPATCGPTVDISDRIQQSLIATSTGPISQHSEYIVPGSEVGAFFAGAIPAAGYGTSSTSTTKMQVDWVRVWSLD